MPFFHVNLTDLDLIRGSLVLFFKCLDDLVAVFVETPRANPEEEKGLRLFWLVGFALSGEPLVLYG